MLDLTTRYNDTLAAAAKDGACWYRAVSAKMTKLNPSNAINGMKHAPITSNLHAQTKERASEGAEHQPWQQQRCSCARRCRPIRQPVQDVVTRGQERSSGAKSLGNLWEIRGAAAGARTVADLVEHSCYAASVRMALRSTGIEPQPNVACSKTSMTARRCGWLTGVMPGIWLQGSKADQPVSTIPASFENDLERRGAARCCQYLSGRKESAVNLQMKGGEG